MSKSSIAILGSGVSFQDNEIAASMGFKHADMQTNLLPARLRRRTSTATKMAFSAAEKACADAHCEPSELPVIFTSALGEAGVTDYLCRDIAKQNFPLSPTKFHNSVHNTASGYWSIAVKSKHPAMAMGGYQDSFALGLMEAWSQLHTVESRVLLVCYEESPSELLLPEGSWLGCASALVLGHGDMHHTQLSMPYAVSQEHEPQSSSPALAAMPLLKMLQQGLTGKVQIADTTTQMWYVDSLKNNA